MIVPAVVAALYAAACAWAPLARCRICAGMGTRRTAVLRRLAPCRWCAGSGRRLRHGRALYNRLVAIRRDAERAAK